MKHKFNKSVAVLLVALLPSLVVASDVAELQPKALPKPVVSVVAVSSEAAQELAKVRDEYANQRAQLRAEYQARIDALLAGSSADNS
jgi:hypothetical protein